MQPLRAKRRALQHAEAMLLVDDHEAELLELHVALHQRVRADDQMDRARLDFGELLAPRRRRRSSRSAARRESATPAAACEMFTKCCSARISVGAMNATCRPFSIATSAASSATIVLPAPTSPCSSRFIGCGRCRSSTISFSACRCPVGQPERQHAPRRLADAIVDRRSAAASARPPRRGAARARPSGTETLPRRSAAAAPASRTRFSASIGTSAGGKCVASSAAYRDGRPSRSANVLRQRIRQVGRQPLQRVVHEPALHLRRDACRSSRRPARCGRCESSRRPRRRESRTAGW